jgi:hypothetical protein
MCCFVQNIYGDGSEASFRWSRTKKCWKGIEMNEMKKTEWLSLSDGNKVSMDDLNQKWFKNI